MIIEAEIMIPTIPQGNFRDRKMTYNRLIKLIKSFHKDSSGETAVQIALFFSFAVLAGTLLVVPMLSSGSKQFAYQKNYGIDPVLTSSVSTTDVKPKRYTISKSVLDQAE